MTTTVRVAAHRTWKLRAALGIAALALLAPALAWSAPPAQSREEIVCRAKSGVGFSYWWGGGCWCASGCSPNFACDKGGCSGNCPSCNHWGGHGADCSGFLNKVWQVPSAQSVNGSCAHGGYVAKSYTQSATHWDKISRSSAAKGDAFASTTHVLLYESGDPWGSMWTYEAKGCSYGIQHNLRTCSSAYSAARRHNIISGECSAGQKQTKGCGNCGSQSRTCSSNGNWGSWSGCGGQGPCSPGKTENAGCGNCGTKSRTCNGSCQWGGFSACSSQGVCAPGQTQKEGCGNCGNKSRSCSGTCQWGGFGSCEGQGPCAPGQTQKEACGDCGEHDRSCTGSCQWIDWSGCEGPDPGGGTLECDTGELGVCTDGIERCIHGWTTCVRTTDPSDEVCDGLDNDCDGPSDEERPTTMGATPPAYAAELTDLSYPPALPPGGAGQAWAEFENVGTTAWKKGAIWLSAAPGPTGGASELHAPGKWPAWDVAAVLQSDVEPGGTARLVLPLRAPMAADTPVVAQMVLLDPDGAAIKCPSPAIELAVKVVPGLAGEGASSKAGGPKAGAEAQQQAPAESGAPQAATVGELEAEPEPTNEAAPKSGAVAAAPAGTGGPADGATGGCRATGGSAPTTGAALLLLLLLMRAWYKPRTRTS